MQFIAYLTLHITTSQHVQANILKVNLHCTYIEPPHEYFSDTYFSILKIRCMG